MVYLLMAAFIFLLMKGLVTGRHSMIFPGDSFDQSYSWLYKVFNAASHGELSLWDFATTSGVSFIGELQTGPLYPLSLLFGWIGPGEFTSTFHWFVILHLVIGVIGFYKLCRYYRADKVSSAFAALLFNLSLAVLFRLLAQPNIFFGVVYMPYMIYGIELGICSVSRRHRNTGVLVFSVSVALAFLAGHVHPVIIASFVGFLLAGSRCYFSYHRSLDALPSIRTTLVKTSKFTVFSLPVIVALVLPQLWATYEYMKLSYKWYGSGHTSFPHVVPKEVFSQHALAFKDFASLIDSHKFLSAGDGGSLYLPAAVYLLILVMAVYAIWKKSGHAWSRTSALRPAVVMFISFVFGFGSIYIYLPVLDNVRQPSRWHWAILLIACVMFALALTKLLNVLRDHFQQRTGGVVVRWLLIAFFGGLVIWSAKSNFGYYKQPPVAENRAFTKLHQPYMAALYGLVNEDKNLYRFLAPHELVPPNIGDLYFIPSADGYRSSRLSLYQDNFSPDPNSQSVRSYGVKYLVTKDELDLPLAWHDDDVKIYDVPDALPVLTNVKSSGRAPVPVDHVSWRENAVEFDLAEPTNGEFVFSQPYYPGFYVKTEKGQYPVENRQGQMASNVLEPVKKVIFEYRPGWFYPTLLLSVLAWVVVLFNLFAPDDGFKHMKLSRRRDFAR